MITKFKIFERLDEGEPYIGNYVIASNKYWSEDQNRWFLGHIGKIKDISRNRNNGTKPDSLMYTVKYEDIFNELPTWSYDWKYNGNEMVFWRNEIVHWSKNKEDLEDFADYHSSISKYNL